VALANYICKFCGYNWNHDNPCYYNEDPCGAQECPMCTCCQGQSPRPNTIKAAKARRDIKENEISKCFTDWHVYFGPTNLLVYLYASRVRYREGNTIEADGGVLMTLPGKINRIEKH
jgi:hypothetical protein